MRVMIANLQNGAAFCGVDLYVARPLAGDGKAISSPEHRRWRVGPGVTADVHWISLPRVEDGLIGLELWHI